MARAGPAYGQSAARAGLRESQSIAMAGPDQGQIMARAGPRQGPGQGKSRASRGPERVRAGQGRANVPATMSALWLDWTTPGAKDHNCTRTACTKDTA